MTERVEDQYMDVLQNIDFAIVTTYREHRDMSDYDVMRVVEAAVDAVIACGKFVLKNILSLCKGGVKGGSGVPTGFGPPLRLFGAGWRTLWKPLRGGSVQPHHRDRILIVCHFFRRFIFSWAFPVGGCVPLSDRWEARLSLPIGNGQTS